MKLIKPLLEGIQKIKPLVCSPVVVVGVGRSGTSILLDSLVQHPEILGKGVAGENPFLGHVGKFLLEYEMQDSQYRMANNRLSIEDFNMLAAWLVFMNSLGTQIDVDGYRKWACKAFPTEATQLRLDALFPDAKYVYIYRNGINVVDSTIRYSGFSGLTFEDACQRWIDSFTWYGYLRQHSHAITVKYEDLNALPEECFSSILSHIDVSSSDNCSDYFLGNKINSSYPSGADTIPESLYGGWSSENKVIFDQICGQKMKELGYR